MYAGHSLIGPVVIKFAVCDGQHVGILDGAAVGSGLVAIKGGISDGRRGVVPNGATVHGHVAIKGGDAVDDQRAIGVIEDGAAVGSGRVAIKRMSGMFFDFKRCGNLVP